MENINTKDFWEANFQQSDQEARSRQTVQFAEAQIEHLEIDPSFAGTILDFGCALGDAIPVYHRAYPKAKLIGLDHSELAIKICNQRFGDLATFTTGDHTTVPQLDIIIASNVFEHLSNDLEIARALLQKCQILYIIVPYQEQIVHHDEHVNSYDERSFDSIGHCESKVFLSKGWTQYGLKLVYQIYFKNLVKRLMFIQPRPRSKQIIFKITREN